MSALSKSLYLESPEVLNFSSIINSIEGDSVILDHTYFYPQGGGQCGDSGRITFDDGSHADIIDTFYDNEKNHIKHKLSHPLSLSHLGQSVYASIDRITRKHHNQLHTALHLVTSFVRAPVTGCRIKANECSIDFDLPELTISKEDINTFLKEQSEAAHSIQIFNMTSEKYKESDYYNEILGCPDEDNLRIVYINDVDSQPCCGTHVNFTSEIGDIECFKIKSHGRKNRRFSFRIVE